MIGESNTNIFRLFPFAIKPSNWTFLSHLKTEKYVLHFGVSEVIQQLRRIHTSRKTLHEQQGPGSQFIMLDYLWQRWSLSPLDPQESSVYSKYIKPWVMIAQVGMISGESLDMIGPPTAGIFIQIGRTFPLGKDHTVHWQLIFQIRTRQYFPLAILVFY